MTQLEIKNVIKVTIIMCMVLVSRVSALEIDPEKKEKAHIIFLISEDPDNYEAHRTIPIFAEQLRSEHDFRVSVLLGEGNREAFNFPGLEILEEADLLVIFCRRVALPPKQLDMVKNYLKAGKPVIGLRTANHAFSVRDKVSVGYSDWWDFVPEILGCENRGYGPEAPGTDVTIASTAGNHPILKNVKPDHWHSDGNVYRVAPLLDKNATILLTGTAENKVEPIAWTRITTNKSRVFYTSLGYPRDFEMQPFRTLLVNGIYWALNAKQKE